LIGRKISPGLINLSSIQLPEQAKLAADSELEEQGLVTVVHVQKVADIGKPLIHFTDKAQPYLLETSEEDVRSDIQIENCR
jgi:hypothetical protein